MQWRSMGLMFGGGSFIGDDWWLGMDGWLDGWTE